jgi:nitronate monooxygenase
MSLSSTIRDRLVMPAICAPMFLVSGPELVTEACKAGLMAGLPRRNARTFADFTEWLARIRADLDAYADAHPQQRIGPLAVNLATQLSAEDADEHLAVCIRYGVDVIISAAGDPTALTARVHDNGLQIFHDVTTLRFAEKAIAAGVDGLTCIGAGGGGHSGLIGHLALIPKIRGMFDGTIVLAGSVSTGAAVRAAEVLGADLAYLGTRFIATQESMADPVYKKLLVDGTSSDLLYTGDIAGVPANWMTESLRLAGLEPDALPTPTGRGRRHDHLPPGAKPWVTIWSAGQGIDLIDDIPTVAELVRRLRAEYVAACRTPDMSDRAAFSADEKGDAATIATERAVDRLVDEVTSGPGAV